MADDKDVTPYQEVCSVSEKCLQWLFIKYICQFNVFSQSLKCNAQNKLNLKMRSNLYLVFRTGNRYCINFFLISRFEKKTFIIILIGKRVIALVEIEEKRCFVWVMFWLRIKYAAACSQARSALFQSSKMSNIVVGTVHSPLIAPGGFYWISVSFHFLLAWLIILLECSQLIFIGFEIQLTTSNFEEKLNIREANAKHVLQLTAKASL